MGRGCGESGGGMADGEVVEGESRLVGSMVEESGVGCMAEVEVTRK